MIDYNNFIYTTLIFSFISIAIGMSWYVRDNKRTTTCENNDGDKLICNNDFDMFLFIIMIIRSFINFSRFILYNLG